MKSSATLMIISGNKMMTKFMQCADTFEQGKVLGEVNIITVNYKENEKLTLKRAELIIYATKKALEDSEVVSFVHLVEIKIGNKIIKNQGEILPYINKEVRIISDGSKWFVLARFIEQRTQLKILTDQHMFITGVGIKTEGFDQIKFEVDKK